MAPERLCREFGAFGPLASIKIMWPRPEEAATRAYMCGFVAFMRRADAARALHELDGKEVLGSRWHVGWGKAVPIPATPFYEAPDTSAATRRTGLPFNARIHDRDADDHNGDRDRDHGDHDDDDDVVSAARLRSAEVRVTVPRSAALLRRIHCCIEYVLRYGPDFEQLLAERERNSADYAFLTDFRSPEHAYYRWRLYSLLCGDTVHRWRTAPLRMFRDGPLWYPPGRHDEWNRGSPRDGGTGSIERDRGGTAAADDDSADRPPRRALRPKDRARFLEMLQQVTLDRGRIAAAMVFCVDRADAAHELIDCLVAALTAPDAPAPLALARLYLLSDVLYNSRVAEVPSASLLRHYAEARLEAIARALAATLAAIAGRLRAETFKVRR